MRARLRWWRGGYEYEKQIHPMWVLLLIVALALITVVPWVVGASVILTHIF